MEEKAKRKSRVLVVDDHPIVSFGLAQTINNEPDLACCCEARNLANARKLFESCKPDLVTVDLRLPDGDGVELIKYFTTADPSIPILVISLCDESIYAERALKAGARGYLMKEHAPGEIVSAIRMILGGELYFSARVAALALNQMAGRKAAAKNKSVEILTDRELQVLQLLGAGVGTRGIGSRLGLSMKTVETHRENIKHKLGISDAAGLVHYAVTWVERQDPRPGLNGQTS